MTTASFEAGLKDSGTRKDFDTGAHRDNSTGKGRLDLLPAQAIIEVAKHFEKGAIKYEARNWEKGIPTSRYTDSALRHLLQFLAGDTDEPHLISATWNLLCLIQTLKWIDQGVLPKTLDDLPGDRVPALHLLSLQYDVRGPESCTLPADCTTTFSAANQEAVGATSCGCGPRLNTRTPQSALADDLQYIIHALAVLRPGVNVREAFKSVCEGDQLAIAAYTDAAQEVYGEYLEQPFIDECTLEGPVYPTAFIITETRPGFGATAYWWDGSGAVHWANGVTPCTGEEAREKFASGEWQVVGEHSFIPIRAYVPSNPASSNIIVLFGVEHNTDVSYLDDGLGRRFANHNPEGEYAFSQEWKRA